MIHFDGMERSVVVLQFQNERNTGSESCQTSDRNDVIFPDEIVVGRILKRQCQHSLLLQICFMDAGKTFHDNRPASEKSRFHRRMFARRSLAVILITDRHPADALCFVLSRNCGIFLHFSRNEIFSFSCLAGKCIHGADKHII